MQFQMRTMIVDDEQIIREAFLHWFEKHGHSAVAAASGPQALAKLASQSFDLIFVDIKMPGMDGIELLGHIKSDYPDTAVVIITAYASIESAVEAMKLGAADYLMKPFRPNQLSLVMEKVRQQKQRASQYDYVMGRLEKMTRFDNIIGQSQPMQKVFELIPEVAQSDAAVLITGETGTGKELVARAIHAKSPRANLPFIAVNCGALTESLLESELFGHEKGAFTHAGQGRKGFLEIVSGGTLFLDEIGEISNKMQMNLLRVLEDKAIYRVGSSTSLPVDFRLVSATSRALADKRREGRLREDFYYRIGVIEIKIPPLRERREDLPLLVDHFLRKYGQETTKKVERVTPQAVQRLMRYDWPGNVRELQNAIERAVVLSRGPILDKDAFSFLNPASAGSPQKFGTLREREKVYVEEVLRENDWNITRSAAVLGINRVTLHKKIKRYGFERRPSDA
jgi:two-component system response regulator HydG